MKKDKSAVEKLEAVEDIIRQNIFTFQIRGKLKEGVWNKGLFVEKTGKPLYEFKSQVESIKRFPYGVEERFSRDRSGKKTSVMQKIFILKKNGKRGRITHLHNKSRVAY